LAQLYGIDYDKPDANAKWRHRIVFDKTMLAEALSRQRTLEEPIIYPKTLDPAALHQIWDNSQNDFSLCMSTKKRR
jgi:hypothetical protein